MKYAWVFPALLLCYSPSGRAQESTPAHDTPARDAPTPSPVLEYRGKPLVLPFRCTAEDIHWAGLGCTEEEPCPLFLELSAVAASGDRLLVAGNIHTESVTLYSTLFGSEVSGQSWSEVHPPIRGAGLDRIQFLDAETGWVSGQELFPIPQNPFLLLTSDGGKTWAQRAVLNESAENRFGTVQQFLFSDKKAGSLIVDRGQGSDNDRYVLYESQTGGESWTIRQESAKPLRLRENVPSVTGFRVRVDAASHAFHIERRQGDRWNLVAAFAVKLDPCKPPPPADAGVGVPYEKDR